MSLDTVKPKGMLIESYDRLSQILIDSMEFESDPVQLGEVLQVWRLELISLADAPRILSLRFFQVAAIRTGGDPLGRRLVFALLTFVPRRRGVAR